MNDTILEALGGGAAAVASAMALAWLWQRRRGDAGVVDVVWAASLAALALWYAASLPGDPLARWVTASLAAIWGVRLAAHLALRSRRQPEDGRYRTLREHWGGRAQPRMFVFFQVQALFALLFSLPLLAAMWQAPRPGGPALAAGIGIWLLAVGGEALADRQLQRFKARHDSGGPTCREGLWRYSRHPNYFFEWLHWFAYPAIGAGAPLWWLTLSGPVLMYVFLNYVTGIPWAERQALRRRGEDYRRYQRETPRFFPWPPRRFSR